MAVLIPLLYQLIKPCVCPNRRSYLGFLSQDTDRYPSVLVRVQASVLVQNLPIDVDTRPGYVQGMLAVPDVQLYPAARFLAPDPDVQPELCRCPELHDGEGASRREGDTPRQTAWCS